MTKNREIVRRLLTQAPDSLCIFLKFSLRPLWLLYLRRWVQLLEYEITVFLSGEDSRGLMPEMRAEEKGGPRWECTM